MGQTDPTIIDATSQALANAFNYAAQANLNKKTRKYNEKIYAKQRADSLSDWTRQNEYNSPEAQMERLREAGLNPNLVYGKGADNTAGAVRSADQPGWNPRAPQVQFDARQSLLTAADLRMKQAQTDNLKVQNTVLEQERLLKQAQTISTLQGTDVSQFDLGMKQTLKDTNLDYRKEELRKLRVDIDFTFSENERKAALNAPTVEAAVAQIFQIRAQTAQSEAERQRILALTDNTKIDSYLKQLDSELKEMGIQPTDGIYLRVLGRVIQQLLKEGKPVTGLMEKLQDIIK